MRRDSPATFLSMVAGWVVLWHFGTVGAQPLLENEVTADGLHRVSPSVMDSAWVRPGVDLSHYTRVFFMPTVVQFREIPERSYAPRKSDSRTEFPVDEQTRARLGELFGESFYEAVSRLRSYELSKELGRDVLMVHGYLTDVVSGVPPEPSGSNVMIVRWAWEASIVLELRDSMSDEVLARTLDQQRVEGPFDADAVWGLTPRIVDGWSNLLTRRIRALSDLYPSRLRRLQDPVEE